MGSAVNAVCECGYRQDNLMIGGGMMTFTTLCLFPCLCKSCSAVTPVNLLRKRLKCETCGSTKVTPYNAPELAGEIGQHNLTAWGVDDGLERDVELTDGTYLCPKCGKHSLRFEEAGLLWD